MDELLANVRDALQAWPAAEAPVEAGKEVEEPGIDLDYGGA